MEVNLLPILNCEGRKMPIEADVQIASLPGDTVEILAPVSVNGDAINYGDSIDLSLKAHTAVRLRCDRCAEAFEVNLEFEITERLKKEDTVSENQDMDPDIIHYTGNSFELDGILYDNLFLNIPSKVLCREDCKGLCSQCGKNLNQGPCGCDDHPTDPRFDVLDQLEL